MWRMIFLACLFIGSSVDSLAQDKSALAVTQDGAQEKIRGFRVPRENILPVIAYQPDSPIEFLKVETLAGVESSGWQQYRFRNRSSKPIKAYKIATMFTAGTGSSIGFEASSPQGYFLPGETYPKDNALESEPTQVEIVPLTEALRKEKKLKGMKAVLIFLVVKVEFADGTVFDDEKTYQALAKFFEDYGIFPEDKDDNVDNEVKKNDRTNF